MYPGQRRSSGGGVAFWKLLSSFVPFSFLGKTGSTLRKQNLTEMAMGWTVALPIGALVAVLGRRALRRDRDRILVVGTLLLALGLASWCVVAWPTLLAKVTFLDYVPPYRLAPFVGFFGTVALALLFGQRDRRERLLHELGWVGALVIGAAMAALAWWATTEFRRQALPGLSNTELWLAVLATGVVTTLLCTRWWGPAAALAAALAITSGIMVNPLVQGVGALGSSPAASQVRHLDRTVVAPHHGTWAADTVLVDALLNGEGVNSLTSFNNPVDTRGWRRLDPDDVYQKQWNRFGYISFSWNTAVSEPIIHSPAKDYVIVTINPCSARLTAFRLRMIVSSDALHAPCLAPAGRLEWMGTRDFLYRRV